MQSGNKQHGGAKYSVLKVDRTGVPTRDPFEVSVYGAALSVLEDLRCADFEGCFPIDEAWVESVRMLRLLGVTIDKNVSIAGSVKYYLRDSLIPLAVSR
ncbi:hypothetical protein [uncultured Ruegeria sp.]|uniref:hypothetical protein n=1 Tax=uncultured Ruegeria sp. TaxID=259304 RepID=UPI00260AC6F4|nr:hypothetical protein [uncultured Ruegeria sp.]